MTRLITLISLFACISFVQARVGETIAECEARYGPVVERRPAMVSGSDAEACVFSKVGITIIAEYKNGKVWRLAYRMAGMDAEAIGNLLSSEVGATAWSAPLKLAGQEFRTSEDRQRVAVLTVGKRPEDPSTFVFASKECAKASRTDYDSKLAMVPEEVKRRVAAKPFKDL